MYELQKIEQIYKVFVYKENIGSKKEDIEYLGINLSSDKSDPEFKVYYKDKYSRKALHPIVEELEQRGMIRTLTQIIDTKNGNCRRYDIGLGNRTNDKMEMLFEKFDQLAPFCTEYKDEIKTMSQMKICENLEYAFAALYFWGFIEINDEIEAMKMHYLTRICEDPDKIGKRIAFDDAYYLKYLEDTEIPQFKELLSTIKPAVTGNDDILWMIGTDYFKHGNHKYKIYFKTPADTYMNKVKRVLQEAEGERKKLAVLLETLEKWLVYRTELSMDGVAVCLDKKGCWSLNFYFKWTE